MADYGRSTKHSTASSSFRHHHHHYFTQTPSLRRSPFSMAEDEGYSCGFRQFDKGSIGRMSLERVIEESGKTEAEIETETVNSVFQFSDKNSMNLPQFAPSSPGLGYSPEFLCSRHRKVATAQNQDAPRDATPQHGNSGACSHGNENACTQCPLTARNGTSSVAASAFQVGASLSTFTSAKENPQSIQKQHQLHHHHHHHHLQTPQQRLTPNPGATPSVPQRSEVSYDRRQLPIFASSNVELLTSSGIDCPCPLHYGSLSQGQDSAPGVSSRNSQLADRGKFSSYSPGDRMDKMSFVRPDIYPESDCNI